MADLMSESRELANATPKINSLAWPRSVINGKIDGQSCSKIILPSHLPNIMPHHSSRGRGGKSVHVSDTDKISSPSQLLVFMHLSACCLLGPCARWQRKKFTYCLATFPSEERKIGSAAEDTFSFIPSVYYWPSGVIRIGLPIWKWKSWKIFRTKGV